MITEKKLIETIKELKEIKPRKEWAVLLKSQILAGEQKTVEIPAQKVSIMDVLRSVFFQKKFAYALAAFVFVVAGIFGISRYMVPAGSPAALTGQTAMKQNVVALNNKINNLAQVAKAGKKNNVPSAINEISANAKDLAKNLKDNPTQDPQTIKDIASSLKTLADVSGADLTANSDVQDLYKTVVQAQIADLKKTTLTDKQQTIFSEAEDLYNQGKYSAALEEIWNLTNNAVSNPASSTDLTNTTSPTNK